MEKAITPEARKAQVLRLQRARRLRLERAGQFAARSLDGLLRALVDLAQDDDQRAGDRIRAAALVFDVARAEPGYEDLAKVEQHLHLHGSEVGEEWAAKVRKMLESRAALKPVNGKANGRTGS